MAIGAVFIAVVTYLAWQGLAEQVCIDTIPGQGAPLHNLSTIVACSPSLTTILDAQLATNLTELVAALGVAANATVTVRVPENATMSDPFPAWCGSYVYDSQSEGAILGYFHRFGLVIERSCARRSNAVLPCQLCPLLLDRGFAVVVKPNFHDNLTASSVTTAATWSMSGLTSRDVDAFILSTAGYGPAPVMVGYSVSRPVDHETNAEMRYIISSEVAARLVHDVDGVPSPDIGIDVPLDPKLHNWTTYTLGVATIELVIVVEDSPVRALVMVPVRLMTHLPSDGASVP
jgi:hypothetical protein